MVTDGLTYSYNPGSTEYVRVPVNIDKSDYYLLDRMRAIILSGMGEVLGATKTQDQETTTIELVSEPVSQMEFEIQTQEARLERETTLVTGTLPTGTPGSTNDLSCTDSSIFKQFDVIVNETTGEQMLVTAIDTASSPNEITVFPAFQSTGFAGKTSFPASLTPGTASAKTNGDVIRIVGNAFPEGSSSGAIYDTEATTAINYIQIFRKEFGLTFEQQQTEQRGRQQLEDKDDRAFTNLIEELESSIISSKIHKQTISGAPHRTMLGMKNTVTTNSTAASALVGGGNDITIPKLDQIGDTVAPHVRGKEVVCLCSGTFIRKLSLLKEGQVTIDTTVGTDDFGVKGYRYKGQKDMVFVQHYEFNSQPDQAFFFDPANFKLRNLVGGELGYVSDKKGLPGAVLTNNSQMAFQDAHYGAYSIDYRNEKGGFLLTGLSHSFS
jgi:hypothetical protein